MYLHELGDGAGSFTKDDMQAGLVFLLSFFFPPVCFVRFQHCCKRAQTQQLNLTYLLKLANHC